MSGRLGYAHGVGRRKQRERRRRRLERAAASGELEQLEREAMAAPARVADVCLKLLGEADPAGGPTPVHDLAARLAQQLRTGGRVDTALALARAGRRRTRLLRLEEALCAFALGQDEGAAELARADAEVERVLAPLLSAVQGRKLRPRRAKRTPALTDLHLVAAATASAVTGNSAAARRALARVSAMHREALLVQPLRHAADLAAEPQGRGKEALRALIRLPTVRQSPLLLQALAAEAAQEGLAEFAREQFEHWQLGDETTRQVRLAPLRGLASLDAGTAARLVRDCGADVFDAGEQAVARLYEGFAWLGEDRQRARVAFERALEGGADLVEVYRGLWQTLRAGFEKLHPGARADKRLAREFASVAQRLHGRLHGSADGAAGALAVSLATARTLAFFYAGPLADEWVARARSDATELGELAPRTRDQLDLVEGVSLIERDAEQALQLAERVLGQQPASSEAWDLKLSAGSALRHPAAADWAAQAAAATGQARFRELAVRLRRRRRGGVPFEGLLPGQASAGALADEIARFAMPSEPDQQKIELERLLELGSEHRAALGSEHREALDGAVLAIACGVSRETLERVLPKLLGDWQQAEQLRRLMTIPLLAGYPEVLSSTACAMLRHQPQLALLEAAVQALLDCGENEQAQQLLGRAAFWVEHSALRRLLRLCEQGYVLEGWACAEAREAGARHYDQTLWPEHSILDLLDDIEAGDGSLQSEWNAMQFAEQIEAMVQLVGLDLGDVANLSGRDLASFVDQLARIVERGPGPNSLERVAALARRFGLRFSPRAGSAGHGSSAAPGRRRQLGRQPHGGQAS